MGFRAWVAGLLGDEVGEVYECRACGTNLTSVDDHCPYCGPTEVVRLELLVESDPDRARSDPNR